MECWWMGITSPRGYVWKACGWELLVPEDMCGKLVDGNYYSHRICVESWWMGNTSRLGYVWKAGGWELLVAEDMCGMLVDGNY